MEQSDLALMSMEDQQKRRKLIFEKNKAAREEFLKTLRKHKLVGEDYSDAIAKYDKVNNSRRLY